MTFQISPGVSVREFDLSAVVPAVATSRGAFAGNFAWGPVEQPIAVSSEDELLATFLGPNDANRVDWLTAASYLAYSNFLYVSRVVDFEAALNSTSTTTGTAGAGLLVKNDSHFDNVSVSGTVSLISRFPGAYGNGLRVYHIVASPSNAPYNDLVADSVDPLVSTLDRTIFGEMVRSIGRNYPGTSKYAADAGAEMDEIHTFVVDYTGRFSGVPGTILEKYIGLSLASDAKTTDGETNYYPLVLNRRSNYVRFGNHPSAFAGTNIGTPAAPGKSYLATVPVSTTQTMIFGGGSDGVSLSDADYIAGYNVYASAENIDISLLIGGARSANVALHLIQNIAETRKDCVVFVSPLSTNVVNVANPVENVVAFRDSALTTTGTSTSTLGGYSSSYAFMDCNWKYMYDRYNDVFAWVPLSGDTAGMCARTDAERDAWWSPAGFNRGNVKNVVKLAWNPTEAQRDILYSAGINPVVNFAGRGTVLFGDKTLLSKPSAFDRINVRRLFIILEKSISIAAQNFLFDFNDQFTRASFVSLVEPFLRDVQGRRGLTKFKVVCDETNNTPQVIQTNSFIGTIFVVPNYSTNYIRLNFAAVGPTANFEEIVGSGVI